MNLLLEKGGILEIWSTRLEKTSSLNMKLFNHLRTAAKDK